MKRKGRRRSRGPAPVPERKPPPTLRALARADLVFLLKQSGSRLASDQALEADQAAGMPTNPDGTFDLLQVAAWLAREAA